MKTVLLASAASISLAALLSACASAPVDSTAPASAAATPSASPPPVNAAAQSTVERARVNLSPASGSLVSGRLTVAPMGDGVHFTGQVGGLEPNSTHAIHIHEKGDCSAADASSAGGHFSPDGQPHGKVGTPTHHAGDMNNIQANAQGVAEVSVHASRTSLGGPNSVLDRAVVVHAEPDDYTSQPSGDAGARVACGLIRAE